MKHRYFNLLIAIICLTSCFNPPNNSSSEQSSSYSESIEESSSTSSSDTSSEEVSSEEISSENDSEISSEEVSSESSSEEVSSEESSSEQASSSEEIIYHQAYFYNDRDLLSVIDVKEGECAYYDEQTPTKEGNTYYQYEFIGWDKPFEPLYDDEFYYAQFEEIKLVYTIQELYQWDDEIDQPLHLNKEINLKDVIITGIINSNTFTVASYNNPLDFCSIEIESLDSIIEEFKDGSIINIHGQLSSHFSRPYVKNATISWGSYGEGETGLSGVVKLDNRETWQKMKREDCFNLRYSDMVIAKIPTILPNEHSTFYATFPGEDINHPMFYIEMNIPPLNEVQTENINNFFTSFNEGSGIYILFQPYLDNDVFKGLWTYDNIILNNFNTPKTYDNIFTDYTYIEKLIKERFIYIDYINMYDESIYNYVTYSGWEEDENSIYKFIRVSMYTHQQNEVIQTLINRYIDAGYDHHIDENDKHWFTKDYGNSSKMHISLHLGLGKVVFEARIKDR